MYCRNTDSKTPEENHTEIELNILKEKISTLESMVLQSNKTIAVLGKTLDKSESKLRRQNVQVERLPTRLDKSKCKNDDCAASLKENKNKTLYQSMRGKLRRYKKMVSLCFGLSQYSGDKPRTRYTRASNTQCTDIFINTSPIGKM